MSFGITNLAARIVDFHDFDKMSQIQILID